MITSSFFTIVHSKHSLHHRSKERCLLCQSFFQAFMKFAWTSRPTTKPQEIGFRDLSTSNQHVDRQIEMSKFPLLIYLYLCLPAYIILFILHWCKYLQWNFFFGTPIQGAQIWSRKNVHIFFVSVTSFEGTPLYSGKGHSLWVPKPTFNLQSRETLALTKWLTT